MVRRIIADSCADFTAEELQSTVEQLNRQYALSGIILSGYTHSGEQLQNIKMKETSGAMQCAELLQIQTVCILLNTAHPILMK